MRRNQQSAIVSMATLLVCLGALLLPAVAMAQIVGDCADCHTMHNSEQGQPVAVFGIGADPATSGHTYPIQNLLKMDCIACHAQNSSDKIVTMPGGSKIPQVYHQDATDLAAGNFAYISGTKPGHEGTSGNRKGHNVIDIVPAESDLSYPPGFRHAAAGENEGRFNLDKFTCAGSMGCHGLRGQVLQTVGGSDGSDCDPFLDPNCEVIDPVPPTVVYRTGLAAFSGYESLSAGSPTFFRGAHHDNFDGYKADGIAANYNASPLANSYRFITRLRGYGNENERWQNNSADSHNEYFGGYFNDLTKNLDYTNTTSCTICHINGTNGQQSRLNTPNSSMSGFCITCHSTFHSSGATNGTSGAFLRHPSDYIIPDRGEYANYTSYDISAPVSRPVSFFSAGMSASSAVTPGADMVMCLSCHVAHASPYDGMLRFDYEAMTAGFYADIPTATAEGGCLACHTAKGVLPENR